MHSATLMYVSHATSVHAHIYYSNKLTHAFASVTLETKIYIAEL